MSRQHHTLLIADLCEKLDPWFSALSSAEKRDLAQSESQRGITARKLYKDRSEHKITTLLRKVGSEERCHLSLLRESLVQLANETVPNRASA